jgi:tetratricopeptide (TPR) repeat protein
VPPASATGSLARRAEAALKDGRPATALDLAKELIAQKPGPDAQALLQRCYLAQTEGLIQRGSFRDAHALLTEAERLPIDDPAWWERLAELRAELGDHTRAVELLDRAPGTTARARVLGRVVDRAMRDGPAGRDLLPADLRPGFDLIRQAFAHYEVGRDDAARAALNGIGLSSPFLDWKLLLRGLIAWAANDTPRAVENWSRLAPDRLPARLADPFRLTADKQFRTNLPADRLTAVARQADQLSGPLGQTLRRLRKQLASEESFPDALETARALLPDLKRDAPELVPRLANILYWSLVAGGQPDDLPRYNRVFGPPPDDPQFFRVQALVLEQTGRLDLAHGMWRKYEEWIARSPDRWPGPQQARARALVLERMGRLARDWLTDEDDGFDELDEIFSFFNGANRILGGRQPLKPPAAECFRRAADLAPDWSTPAIQLLQEHADHPDQALPAIENLLRRFPSDLVILESAADLYEKLGDAPKAHDCLRRALTANPLDRRLRQRAAGLAVNTARHHAASGQFDEARAALREAAVLSDGPRSPAVLALAAAIEVRVGDAAAAQTHRELLMGMPDGRLAAAYRLAVEGARLKLKKKDLTPLQAAFTEGLAGSLTAGELAGLLDALAQYRGEPAPYRGMKAHERKILDRVTAAGGGDLAEEDLVRLGLALHDLRLWKPLRELAERGLQRFVHNAHFPFFAGEAAVARQRSDYVGGRAGALYVRTKQLMNATRDDRYRRLQELLDERIQQTPDVERWLNARWAW